MSCSADVDADVRIFPPWELQIERGTAMIVVSNADFTLAWTPATPPRRLSRLETVSKTGY
jgi:hypothetical protein